MAVLKLNVNSKRNAATLTQTFEQAGGSREIAQKIVNYVTSVFTGTESASSAGAPSIGISIQENAIAASGQFVFSNVATANDTVLINGVTFTCVASGATGNNWDRGSTATTSAANLAIAVNRSVSSLIEDIVTASTPVAGTCRITSDFYGVAGNQCTIAEGVDGGSVITVSGPRLTGGADDPTALVLEF